MCVNTRRLDWLRHVGRPVAIGAMVLLCAAEFSTAVADIPGFKTAEEMIPMRDGVKLHTLIFTPEGLQGKLPILFLADALRHRRPGDVAPIEPQGTG